jgi:hypothetical protein
MASASKAAFNLAFSLNSCQPQFLALSIPANHNSSPSQLPPVLTHQKARSAPRVSEAVCRHAKFVRPSSSSMARQAWRAAYFLSGMPRHAKLVRHRSSANPSPLENRIGPVAKPGSASRALFRTPPPGAPSRAVFSGPSKKTIALQPPFLAIRAPLARRSGFSGPAIGDWGCFRQRRPGRAKALERRRLNQAPKKASWGQSLALGLPRAFTGVLRKATGSPWGGFRPGGRLCPPSPCPR